MTRSPSRSLRGVAALVLAGSLASGLAGCSDDAAPATTPASQVIDVTFAGDTVVPNGDRVDAAVGSDLTLHVTADAPGEIHVHSSPEQELSYAEGITDLHVKLDQPGIIDVESHDLDAVILQVEVR